MNHQNLTNGGKPHVCGTIQVHNNGASDDLPFCPKCRQIVDTVRTETTPAKEWREEKAKFDEMWNAGQFHWNENKKNEINPQRIWNVFIEPLLDQHSDHLVAKARDCTRGLCAEDCIFCDNEITLDQAVDIVKSTHK